MKTQIQLFAALFRLAINFQKILSRFTKKICLISLCLINGPRNKCGVTVLVQKALAHLAIIGLVFNPIVALADLPITPDGSTNTQVTQTATGIDQVNIAAPNAAGLSHNRFTDYNVNTAGQVINNFSGANGGVVGGSGGSAVTNTNIGGLVLANPNLVTAGREASVIMNEVTSTNNSQLLGYTEIAGGSAKLIIANPNGIACSSCGFINTSQLAMIAGKSSVDANGNLVYFDLSGGSASASLAIPLITIEGLGLDANTTSYTDIIASSVKLIGGVYGSDSTQINIKTGDDAYNYSSGVVTSSASSSSTPSLNNSSELFAIDASNLGAIQAGRIFLVATKAGLGVNMAGSVIANKEINIDTQGNIYYTTLASETSNIAVKSNNGGISTTNSSSIIKTVDASATLNLQASAEIVNAGTVNSKSITVTAGGNFTNSGNIISSDDISITSTLGNILNSGNILSYKDLTITATSGNITNSNNITAAETLTLNANLGDILNSSDSTLGYLSLENSDSSITEIFTQSLVINSKNLTNLGAITASSFTITNSETLDNSNSITSATDSEVTSNKITNSGIIKSDQNLTVTANSSDLNNTSPSITNTGYLAALETLTINATSGSVTNSNQILSNGLLTINAYNLNNISNASGDTENTSLITSLADSLNLNITNQIINSAELSTYGSLTISDLNTLENSGKIFFNQAITLSVTDFSNSNIISSNDSLTINSSSSFDNSGYIISSANLTISASNTLNASILTNSGLLKSTSADVEITADQLKNSGVIYTANSLNITVNSGLDSILTNSGTIEAATLLTISASQLINSSDILGSTTLNLTISKSLTNTEDGTIEANNFNILNSGDITNSGTIRANNNLTANLRSLSNLEGAIIYSVNNLDITASSSYGSSSLATTMNIDNYGSIIALNNLTITNSSGSTNNYSEILSNGDLTITSQNLTNSGSNLAANNSLIYSALNSVNLTITNSLANSGNISSNESVSISGSNQISNSGLIEADQVNITDSANLTNSGTINSNELLISITATLNNDKTTSIINGYTSSSITSKDLSNSGTITGSNQKLYFVDNGSLTNTSTGTIESTSTLNIGNILTASNLFSLNNSGSITADSTLTINSSGSLTNAESGIIASISDLTITSTASLSNSNRIFSYGAVTINSSNLSNAKNPGITSDSYNLAQIFSDQDLTFNTSTFTNSSQVLSNADLIFNDVTTLTNSGAIDAYNITANNTNSLSTFTNTNTGQIQSENNIQIATGSLINSSNIISGYNLTIDAVSGTVTNNNLLQATNNIIINANSLDNSATLNTSTSSYNSPLILASRNLTINALTISNTNTKPTTTSTTLTSGIAASGDVNLNSENINNNYGQIRGANINTAYLDHITDSTSTDTTITTTTGSLILSNDSGDMTSTGAININLGDADYTITGTYTAADYVDITAKNITNLGNVTTTDYIKLTATSGSITNGINGGDNSNIKLESGSYFTASATTFITNYATLTSNTNMTLTTTSDLNNYGEILVKNDLSITAGNDLNNNSTALIWSGNDSTYNITNNLINTSATIYSVNNLTLQKNSSTDSSTNKMTSLQNISGTIQAQNGEIYIKAISLENKRDADDYKIISTDTTSSNNELENLYEGSDYGWVHSGWWGLTLVRFNVPNLPYQARYSYLISDGAQTNSYIQKTVLTKRVEDSSNAFSKISAGSNIFINSTNFTNDSSQIIAGTNISIDTTNFSNNSRAITNTVNHKCVSSGSCKIYDTDNPIHNPELDLTFGTVVKTLGSGGSFQFEVESSSMIASIKAGGSLNITQNGTPNSDWTSGDSNIVEGASNTSTSKVTKDSSFSGINPITLLTTGEIDIDLSSILSILGTISTGDSSSSEVSGSSFSTTEVKKTTYQASSASGSGSAVDTSATSASIADSDTSTANTTINSGLFKIHKDTNPNTPLIESRSQFTSLGEFYGSDYFYEQLGISKQLFLDAERASINSTTKTVRMLGDSFVENKLVADQLAQIRKDALLLSNNEANTNAEIKRLIDNAVSEKTRLNLDITKGLSTDQVNSLDKDILWFEATTINGQFVIVPKIYLSLATRNSLLGTNATVDDLSSASSLASITSNMNSTTLGNSSLASTSTIFSKGSLTINSPTANLSNSGSIISRAGDVNINVGSISSVSNSFANASIKALTISTDSSAFATSGYSATSSGGNINITANSGNLLLQNTILNSQSKLSVTSLSSSGNISIINNNSLKLSSLPTSLSSSSFSTLGTKDDAANARSSATFNSGTDIEITSSGNINIANNYLNTGGSIYMTAAKDINNSNYIIKASNNVVMDAVNINNISTATSTNKDTLSETRIEATNMVSLNASKDSDGNGGNITNIGATINAGSLLYLTAENNITNKALIEYNINGNLTYSSGLTNTQTSSDFNNSTSNPTLDSTGTSTADTNLLTSNANYIRSNLVNQGTLSSGGNLVLVAGNNINNIGSNITSTGASYLEATSGDINITTAALRDRTVLSGGSKKKAWTSTTDNTSNIQSNITSGGDLDMAAIADSINIKGSNITAADNMNLVAKNDITIQSAQDTTYSFAAGRTGRGKSYLNRSGSTTQIESNLTTTNNGNITLTSGYENTDTIGAEGSKGSIAIIASNLTTKDSDADSSNNTGSGNLTLTAKEELLISSALNNSYSYSISGKKGNTVKKTSMNINDSETNVMSDITINGNFTSTSGSDTNIIASNISGQGSADIIAGKYVDSLGATTINNNASVNIFNAVDSSYSYQNSVKEKTGALNKIPVVAQVLSLANNFLTGFGYRVFNGVTLGGYEQAATNYKHRLDIGTSTEKLISTNLNFNNDLNITSASDLNLRSSNLTTTSGDIALTAGNDVNITAAKAKTSTYRNESGKSDRLKSVDDQAISNENSKSSSIQSGNDLTITSVNDTTLQASNINATNDVSVNAGNNLLLTAATDTNTFSEQHRSTGTYWQSNAMEGRFNTNITNTNITSNNGANTNISLDASNVILAEYQQDNSTGLNYLNNLDSSKTILNPITEMNLQWDSNTRMLTSTGTAVVAIGVVAATIVTAGAAGVALTSVAGATGTAVAGTAATQVTVSTANNGGNLGRGVKTLDDKESLKAMAISGITAGLTAGLTSALTSSATTTASTTTTTTATTSTSTTATTTATTTTNTVATSATTNLASNSTSYTINSSRLLANLGTGLTKAAIATTSGVVATSVVTGDSISQAIKNQGGANQLLLNIALNAAGEIGAKEIGIAAHGITDINGNYIVNPIAKSTQLALHAGIGCVMGSQSGNCAAGAAGAVAGEIVAESYFNNQLENNGATIEGNTVIIDPTKTNLTLAQVNEFKLQASQLASLAGGLAAVPFAGSDDASAVYAGSNAGGNSAVNNAINVWVQEVAADNYHTSVKIEPENQDKYKDDPRFKNNLTEDGKVYATIGGGPDNSSIKGLGNLIGNVNRTRDVDPLIKVYESPNLVSTQSEDNYIETLFSLERNYQDNLKYNLFPDVNSLVGYNSNSYTSGILTAANIKPPILPTVISKMEWQDREYPEISQTLKFQYTLPQFPTPGYNKPVPKQYFGVQ